MIQFVERPDKFGRKMSSQKIKLINLFQSESYDKLLFNPEFVPEKNQSGGKYINTHFHFWMFLYDGPCFFHFAAPVNIMYDDQGSRRNFVYKFFKIFQYRGLFV